MMILHVWNIIMHKKRMKPHKTRIYWNGNLDARWWLQEMGKHFRTHYVHTVYVSEGMRWQELVYSKAAKSNTVNIFLENGIPMYYSGLAYDYYDKN